MTKIFIETLEEIRKNVWKVIKTDDKGKFDKNKLQYYKNEKNSTTKTNKQKIRIHKCTHDNKESTACEILEDL